MLLSPTSPTFSIYMCKGEFFALGSAGIMIVPIGVLESVGDVGDVGDNGLSN
jgi:hypothetical protein